MFRNAILLCLGLFVLASCGTTPTQTAESSETRQEEVAATLDPTSAEWLEEYADELVRMRAEGRVPADEAPAVEPAANRPSAAAPATEAPTPSSAAGPQDAAQALADAARAHAQLVDERIGALVDRFIDEGLAALERGDLEDAYGQFGHAWELDPTNPAARDLYNRTGSLLDEDGASLRSVADTARSLAQVRSQQREVLVEHKLEQGRTALAAGDAEAALRHFSDALVLLRSHPSGGAHSEADIKALIDQAEYEVQQQAQQRDEQLAQRALDRQQELDFAEQNRLELKIEGLLRSANEAFLRDEFDDAVEGLDEILRLDPRHEEAIQLRRIATRARHENTARAIRGAFRDQWVRTFDDLQHDTIVPNDLIEFPDAEDWARIETRGPKSFSRAEDSRPQDEIAVASRLDEVRIPVSFDGIALDEVLNHLADVTQVNFLMSPDVEDALIDNDDVQLFDRNPLPVSRILKIVLEDLATPPMTHTIQDGIVRVITQDESRGDYVLELYDIRDLTFTPVDHASEDFNLLPSGTDPESFTEGPEDEEPLPLVSEDTLLSLIQDNISPDSWTDDPERTINQMPGTLIVRQTPDVHSQIRQLLDDLRANTTTLINIETRFIEVEDSFLEDIGVDLRGLDPGTQGSPLEDFGEPGAGGVGTPDNPQGIGTGGDSGAFYTGKNGDLKGRTENLFDTILGETGVLTGGGGLSLEALFLDDTNVNAVLRAVTKYQNSNIVNAPSLTLRSGQRGNITVLTNRTYVRDFEPEIAQSAVIAQPELDVVKDGIVLDVRAVASADKRFITLELRPTVAELVPDANGDVLPEELVSLGTLNANNVVIQLPELKIQRLRTTATVPDGATLLLGGLKTSVEQDLSSETPFLADIPLIGSLFRRQGEYSSRRKLLILLKSTILAPEEHEPTTGFLR